MKHDIHFLHMIMKKTQKRKSPRNAKEVITNGIRKIMERINKNKLSGNNMEESNKYLERVCSMYIHHVFPMVALNKSKVSIEEMNTNLEKFIDSSYSIEDMLNQYIEEVQLQVFT